MAVGYYGLLSINQDTGEITFVPDARLTASKFKLTIKLDQGKLDGDDLDGRQINIDARSKHRNTGQLATLPPTPSTPTTNKAPAPVRPVAKMPMPFQYQSTDKQLAKARKSTAIASGELYPTQILPIYLRVLDGTYEGPNPEFWIDNTIGIWMAENIVDMNVYLKALAAEVKAQNCLDIILTRMNHELISRPQENSIKIMYGRKLRLMGEHRGVGEDREEIQYDKTLDDDGMPVNGPELPAFQEIYEHCEERTIPSNHVPLAEAARERLLSVFENVGFVADQDISAVASKLEDLLRKKSAHQNIIARLMYLAFVHVSNSTETTGILAQKSKTQMFGNHVSNPKRAIAHVKTQPTQLPRSPNS